MIYQRLSRIRFVHGIATDISKLATTLRQCPLLRMFKNVFCLISATGQKRTQEDEVVKSWSYNGGTSYSLV